MRSKQKDTNVKKSNGWETAANALKHPITSKLIAILCGFIVAAIVMAISGFNPIDCFGALFQGIFSKPKYMANVVIKATPILLTSLSIAFSFKVGLFNIGAEGQYIVGTVAATVVGILCDLPAILQIPLVILAGMVAGGLWGGFVGYLKAKFGINEVITGIMCNWIAFYLCNYVVNTNRFHQPNSTGTYAVSESSYTMILGTWKMSDAGRAFFAEHPVLSELILKTDANFGFIIAILVAFLIAFILKKTTKGYELRAVGFNEHAAEFAGINVKKNIIHAMLISGVIAGLAGALTITGISPHRISTLGSFENFGFNGMSVALIAGSNPIGCIFAALLYAGLSYGGGSVQSVVGAPSEVINIMLGTIVFFIALTSIIPILADKLSKRGKKNV